jgi:Concanavalin A-like lectin/glucanases superfamily
MALLHSPRIITDGLVLCLDAANKQSYPGSGTVWTDLAGNGYNFNLVNSPIYGLHKNTPCFTFSGTNDYATRAGSILHDIGTSCTISIIMASVNNSNFGSCSRLFSVNNGSTNNVDFSEYFCLASCNQNLFALWYKNAPGGLAPTSLLRTVNDDFKNLTFRWIAGSTTQVFVNGIQEASSNITSAFNYLNVNRMTIGMNSSLTQENSTVRVALVTLYNRALNSAEIQQNYNATKGRFNL